VNPNFLAFLGTLLLIEQAVLYLVVAQVATAVAVLVLAFVVGRRR